MKNKWTVGMIFITIIISLSIFLLGFDNKDYGDPKVVYSVYLDGKVIGNIVSKDSFEEYINTQEETIKQKYKVDTIYAPKGVEIKKTVTYNSHTESNQVVYNKIIALKKFTIKGMIITIDNPNIQDYKKKTINVLSKKVFDEALQKTVKAFVDTKDYEAFMNSTQEEIDDTGSIIENIDLQENVTYKESLISTDSKIFTDIDELAKYLLYGSIDEQETYTVKAGDTIEDVANEHKLNVREFLIANPNFTSENNLLYENQKVVVGLINPIISIVVDVHAVEEEEKNFETEIQYDSNQYAGYQNIEREGENGLYKVTRKYQYINGQLSSAVVVNSTELKPSVNRILVKGDKYAPSVADLSYWTWPTNSPYTITSGYGWRWGEFHAAIDIYVGYNSPIYAANNGVVVKAVGGCSPGYLGCNQSMGNFIIINHNAGNYYTIYMHLSAINVSAGQTVARGQRIGAMGNTGNVSPVPYSGCPYCGTHLHFGVYIGEPYNGGYHISPYSIF